MEKEWRCVIGPLVEQVVARGQVAVPQSQMPSFCWTCGDQGAGLELILKVRLRVSGQDT